MPKIIINIDGGSRGNPGPGAIAVVISDEKHGILKKYGEAIGVCTNNEAEYQALILALKKVKLLFGKPRNESENSLLWGKDKIKSMTIEVCSDSELLVKQMRGEYKVLEPSIQGLFLKAWNLKVELKNVYFTIVPREYNKLADQLVNETLDAFSKKQKLFV